MTCAGASEHEVGRVAAHREEEQKHHALQDDERAREHELRPAWRAPEGKDVGVHAGVRLGIELRELHHRHVCLGLSARKGCRLLESRHDVVAAHASIVELARRGEQRRRQRRRHPEIEFEAEHRALKVTRRNTNDRERAIVDAQRLPEHARRAVVARLPELVGDDDDGLGAGSRRLIGP